MRQDQSNVRQKCGSRFRRRVSVGLNSAEMRRMNQASERYETLSDTFEGKTKVFCLIIEQLKIITCSNDLEFSSWLRLFYILNSWNVFLIFTSLHCFLGWRCIWKDKNFSRLESTRETPILQHKRGEFPFPVKPPNKFYSGNIPRYQWLTVDSSKLYRDICAHLGSTMDLNNQILKTRLMKQTPSAPWNTSYLA